MADAGKGETIFAGEQHRLALFARNEFWPIVPIARLLGIDGVRCLILCEFIESIVGNEAGDGDFFRARPI